MWDKETIKSMLNDVTSDIRKYQAVDALCIWNPQHEAYRLCETALMLRNMLKCCKN